MSLWEVDDEATQLLMTAFYAHFAQGKTKRDALKAAQQEVRGHQFIRGDKEISGKAPCFWAGFILMDEWELDIKTGGKAMDCRHQFTSEEGRRQFYINIDFRMHINPEATLR